MKSKTPVLDWVNDYRKKFPLATWSDIRVAYDEHLEQEKEEFKKRANL